MYDYRPPRNAPKATVAALLLLIAAVTALFGAGYVPHSPLLLQCVGLLLLIPAIRLIARYVILQYLYRLRPNDRTGVDFEVYAYRGGDRMQLVCRVALSEITAVAPLDKSNKKAPDGIRRHRYLPDLSPQNAVVLTVQNADGTSEVVIAPDERLLALLRRGSQGAEVYDPAEKVE